MKNVSMIAVAILATILTTGCQKTVEKEVPADLRLYELSGDVKNVQTYCTSNTTEQGTRTGSSERHKVSENNFDENGNLLSRIESGKQTAINRDENERIISTNHYKYVWGDNGLPAEEYFDICDKEPNYKVFTYNAKGQVVADTMRSTNPKDKWVDIRTYTYLESDQHGNWTKRLANVETVQYDGTRDTIYELQERTISYYSDAEETAPVEQTTECVSADLSLFGLYGKAKSITILRTIDVSENGEETESSVEFQDAEYSFDENGNLDAHMGEDVTAHIVRDGDGRIISLSVDCEKPDGEWNDGGFEIEYTWDQSGKPAIEKYRNCIGAHYDMAYSYDENGQATGSTANWSGEGNQWISIKKYTVLASDKHGNWTKRLVRIEEHYGEGDPMVSHELETREITYFE